MANKNQVKYAKQITLLDPLCIIGLILSLNVGNYFWKLIGKLKKATVWQELLQIAKEQM